MIITCPVCKSQFGIPKQLAQSGRSVTCIHCSSQVALTPAVIQGEIVSNPQAERVGRLVEVVPEYVIDAPVRSRLRIPSRPAFRWPSRRRVATLMLIGLVSVSAWQGVKYWHIQEKPWQGADFVLVDEAGFAVAVHAEGDSYSVLDKASGSRATRAVRIASEAGVRVVSPEEPSLTQYVHRRTAPGETLAKDLAEQLSDYWPINRRVWKTADMVLANPTFAFAFDYEEKGGRYLLREKASGKAHAQACASAREEEVPIIEPDDPSLAREIHRGAKIGEPLVAQLADRVANLWPFDAGPWRKADFVICDDAYAVALDDRDQAQVVLAKAEGRDVARAKAAAAAPRLIRIDPAEDRIVDSVYQQSVVEQPIDPRFRNQLNDYWPFDSRVWRKADFVMLNPKGMVVALRWSSTANFALVAKEQSEQAQRAVETVYTLGIPIINRDPDLVGRIHTGKVGDPVEPELATRLTQFWREHTFLPPIRKFAAFTDYIDGRHRSGFLLKTSGKGFEFQPFASLHPEIVPSDRILPGSFQEREGLHRIRELKNVDFLNYCVVNMVDKLQSLPGKPKHLYVAVNEVKTDALDSELKLADRPDDRWEDRWFEFQARLHGGVYPENKAKEPTRNLQRFAKSLKGEIEKKLSDLGVPLLEREELASVMEERKREQTGFRFGDALQEGPLGASHYVFTELRRPAAGGEYELTMRLVDVATTRIVWEDQFDRDFGGGDTSYEQPSYLLQPANLVSLKIDAKGLPYPPEGGWPIVVQQERMASPLLGEQEGDGSQVIFRDLFSKHSTYLQARASEHPRSVQGIRDVPGSHRMRYLVWRIAKFVLPRAGRVATINGKNVRLTLGQTHGLRAQDELSAVRVSSSPTPTVAAEQLLDVRLKVSLTRQSDSDAYVESGEDALRVGDILFQKASRPLSIAVVEPIVNIGDKKLQEAYDGMNTTQLDRFDRKVRVFANAIGGKLSAGLRALPVKLAVKPFEEVEHVVRKKGALEIFMDSKERKALIDRLRVTHLVQPEISPALDETYSVEFKVVDTGTMDSETITNSKINHRMLQSWQP